MNDLEQILIKAFKESDDSHVSCVLDEIEEIDDYDEISDIWEDDGKYSHGDMEFMILYKKARYYISVAQSRSGSYFSDYYYDEPTLYSIQTEKEYKAPKIKLSFSFRNNTIEILDNNTTRVVEDIFSTTEEAINFIINNLTNEI